jgi:hypothetical protein
MTVYYDNEELDIRVTDESYRMMQIMGENSLTLYFESPVHLDIPPGAWTEFRGETYTLSTPQNFSREGSRIFKYTLIMESSQAALKKYKFKDVTSRRLKFSLTGTPAMHIAFLIDNLNLRESGWQAGMVTDATEKAISYNHNYCLEALNMMAEAFDTEWEVSGKTISLCKIEYNKDNPLPLSYGRGNGFKPGLGRANSDGGNPVEILYVQGGERNIDSSTYGSRELLLPDGQELEYEGRTYVADGDGFSMRRADRPLQTGCEDSLDCTNIYPSRVGTISGVTVVDEENHFYDIIDDGIPENLDYSQFRIAGEKATVIFQDGMLAGKEFDIEQTDNNLTGYIHSERRFRIVPQEIDGDTMPNAVFTPAVGGKYAVFNIALPQAYIRDDATMSGASWDMFREGAKYLYEHEDPHFSFTGELDGIYARQNWSEIGDKLLPGGYVLFSDPDFLPEGSPIRIISVKQYINSPHSPVIELSNARVGVSISSQMKYADGAEEERSDSRVNGSIAFTKRTFRDVRETLKMMFDPEGDYFTELIKPLAVETAHLVVGTNSQQFVLRGVKFIPNYGGNPNVFGWTEGFLDHFTINNNGTVRTWEIGAANTPPVPYTLDGELPYYVYAKCPKASGAEEPGVIYLSEDKILLEQDALYYHFLVGVLNTPFDGVRSWQPTFGYTEIAGDQITTGVIKDANANFIIDLLSGSITAKLITLTGDITANGNVHINQNGTVVARGGIFNGFIQFPFKRLDESDATRAGDNYTLGSDVNLSCEYFDGSVANIILPASEAYNGVLVNIFNPHGMMTYSDRPVTVSTQDQSDFFDNAVRKSAGYDTAYEDRTRTNVVQISKALGQFLGVLSGGSVRWVLMNVQEFMENV